jgi:hypothetical protein
MDAGRSSDGGYNMSKIRVYLPEDDRFYWLCVDMNDTGSKGQVTAVGLAANAKPSHSQRAREIARKLVLGIRSDDHRVAFEHKTGKPKLQGESDQGRRGRPVEQDYL